MTPMRALSALLLLLIAACGVAPAPAATPPPAPTIPAVAEILNAPTAGPLSTAGYLYVTSDGAMLADSLSLVSTPPAPPDNSVIWIGPPPELPANAFTEAGPVRYAVVAASGTLEGPGQFGPGGRYPYRLSEPALRPLTVRELTFPLLLQNSGLYEGQAVRVRGELLVSADAALLVEKLGAGGVPEPDARQMKLATPPRDEALLDRLRASGSGDIRFGPVEVTGIWRAGRLYPLGVVTT
jgi:hypothetical protein